jgi:cyclin B
VKTITIGDSLIGTLSMKPKENVIKSYNNNNDEMNTHQINNNISVNTNRNKVLNFRIENPSLKIDKILKKESNTENKENIEKNMNLTTRERRKFRLDKYSNSNTSEQTLVVKSQQKHKKEKIIYFDISKIPDNVQIPKEYMNKIYLNLLKEEEAGVTPKARYNYMKEQKEINQQMRSILIDWLIDVHYKFGFTDETLFMTVSIIDRYLSVNQISRLKLQLLGITALLIACKHEEIDLPKIGDFTYITDNAYVKDEVIQMENDVLKVLNFSLLYPSPIKFYEYLSVNFGFDKKMHLMGKYLMESFLVDIKHIKYKPSIISSTCIYIVMKFFKKKNYQESYDNKFYSLITDENAKYTEHDVKDCAKDICLFVDNISKTKFLSCQKKYAKPELEKVSIIIMNN